MHCGMYVLLHTAQEASSTFSLSANRSDGVLCATYGDIEEYIEVPGTITNRECHKQVEGITSSSRRFNNPKQYCDCTQRNGEHIIPYNLWSTCVESDDLSIKASLLFTRSAPG